MKNVITEYPNEIAPTLLVGFNWGGIWRAEGIHGGESIKKGPWLVINQKPFRTEDGSTVFVSNLQKESKFGFLIQKPFCWHHWIMPGKQKKNESGMWLPETERGWYFRIGWWRFDVPGTIVHGELRHWMGPFTAHPFGKWD